MQIVKTGDGAWYIENDDGVAGIITERGSSFIVIYDGKSKIYNNEKELNVFLGRELPEYSIPKIKDKSLYVNGYPVKHPDTYEVESNVSIPVYAKAKNTLTRHCAGYYCVLFSGTWIPSFCPKLTTLESHDYFGPYKTIKDQKAKLSRLRRP